MISLHQDCLWDHMNHHWSLYHFYWILSFLLNYIISIETGIKTGRYTYQKRTKDILELQQLKKDLSEARNQETKRQKEIQSNDLINKVIEIAKRHPDIIFPRDALVCQQKYLVRGNTSIIILIINTWTVKAFSCW